MPVDWHEVMHDPDQPAAQATLHDKAAIVCRTGRLLLSAGTGSWRVREAMNRVARALGITCTVDLGLLAIECTCVENGEVFTKVDTLASPGVNTERIHLAERYLDRVEKDDGSLTVRQYHELMDEEEHRPGRYSAPVAGLASAFACAAFVFLLGGGLVEMGCAFVGAGVGHWLRREMLDRHINQLTSVGVSVAASCLCYLGMLQLLALWIPGAAVHQAGYVGAMLFVIPGFPLITSGLDIAKLDLRSGLERLAYALVVILVATLAGWLVASFVQLSPDDFSVSTLPAEVVLALRLVASFVGVFGFSIMFNSPVRMASTAGLIGAVANTLRLELVDFAAMPPEAAAFLGALCAGLLASAVCPRTTYPRISLTVPSIVIMVPGLYMYRAVYYLGWFDSLGAMEWFARAAMIVVFLPIGLALARVISDENWRYCS